MSEMKYPKKSPEVCARCKYWIFNNCSGLLCPNCPIGIRRGKYYRCKCLEQEMGEPCSMFEESERYKQ